MCPKIANRCAQAPLLVYKVAGSSVWLVERQMHLRRRICPLPSRFTQELRELAKPVVPTEVFRFAAPCVCSGCAHFAAEASKCRLVEKVVRWMPVVAERLPACAIRPSCRWWQQEGRGMFALPPGCDTQL